MVKIVFVSLFATASAGACSADEQAALADPAIVGKAGSDCGLTAYNPLTGNFNHDKFKTCFMGKIAIGDACAECFAENGDYAAQNCKVACLAGWCKEDCLSCSTAPEPKAALDACTGYTSASAEPCLESTSKFGCSGTADPAGPACYEGSAGALGLTETVKVNILEVNPGAGKMEFIGSGITGFTCSDKTYTKSGTDVTLSDLSDCLPKGVEVSKTQYCSDDDILKITVKDTAVPLPVTATLKNVPCDGFDAFASCTGDADPVVTAAQCYKGKAGALGLTETVTIKVTDFASSAGHVDLSGEGIESFTCAGKSVTKSGQEIALEDSSDCLPSGIEVSDVKYCSDSDTMKITVKDKSVPLPISAIASRIDCPASVEV